MPVIECRYKLVLYRLTLANLTGNNNTMKNKIEVAYFTLSSTLIALFECSL
jgi:hypothetical protein